MGVDVAVLFIFTFLCIVLVVCCVVFVSLCSTVVAYGAQAGSAVMAAIVWFAIAFLLVAALVVFVVLRSCCGLTFWL